MFNYSLLCRLFCLLFLDISFHLFWATPNNDFSPCSNFFLLAFVISHSPLTSSWCFVFSIIKINSIFKFDYLIPIRIDWLTPRSEQKIRISYIFIEFVVSYFFSFWLTSKSFLYMWYLKFLYFYFTLLKMCCFEVT